jgi:hypothetical protein
MVKKIKRSLRAESARIKYPILDTIPSIQKRPIFSFLYLQDNYCISRCSKAQKVGFTDTMRALSKMTWHEIRSAPKHGLGSEKIERRIIRVSIPSNISDDVTFISIRFHANAPMVGFRKDNIFHIVWFDRDFTVYDHGS